MQPSRVAYGIDRRGARNAVVFHALFCTGFSAFGIAAWTLPESFVGAPDEARIAFAAVAFLGAAWFGWISLRFLVRLQSGAPLFVLDPKGLYDNGSAMFSGVGWIPWSEVLDVRVGRYHNLPCVELILTDRDRFLERVPWIGRAGRSERLGYPAVAFRGPLLPDHPERIVEEIRAYIRSLSSGAA